MLENNIKRIEIHEVYKWNWQTILFEEEDLGNQNLMFDNP